MSRDKSEELADWIVEALAADKLEAFNIKERHKRNHSTFYDCYDAKLIIKHSDGTFYDVTIKPINDWYDSEFGDGIGCECGHDYYRHFDTYDKMSPVGCKYCDCYTFMEKMTK